MTNAGMSRIQRTDKEKHITTSRNLKLGAVDGSGRLASICRGPRVLVIFLALFFFPGRMGNAIIHKILAKKRPSIKETKIKGVIAKSCERSCKDNLTPKFGVSKFQRKKKQMQTGFEQRSRHVYKFRKDLFQVCLVYFFIHVTVRNFVYNRFASDVTLARKLGVFFFAKFVFAAVKYMQFAILNLYQVNACYVSGCSFKCGLAWSR